jgi:hypothetical protein
MAVTVTPSNQTRAAEPLTIIRSEPIRAVISAMGDGVDTVITWYNKTTPLYVDSNNVVHFKPFAVKVKNVVIVFGDIDSPNTDAFTMNLASTSSINYFYVDYTPPSTPGQQSPASVICDTTLYDDKLLIATYNPSTKEIVREPGVYEAIYGNMIETSTSLGNLIYDLQNQLSLLREFIFNNLVKWNQAYHIVSASEAANNVRTFNTTFEYEPNVGRLEVFLNGLRLVPGLDYTEPNSTQVTLTSNVPQLEEGDILFFRAPQVLV